MPPVTSAPAAPGSHKGASPALLVPFTRAADEHEEQFFDESIQIGAGTQQRGPFPIPAYGFMRAIVLDVSATGGVSAVATAANEDAPFIAIQEVALLDVNSAPIVGPFTGYDLYLINKYGGYKFLSDPKQLPSFTATVVGANASGNFAFQLRIPVEIAQRDALGALPNQNASSAYQVRYTLNSSAAIYTTAPSTTLPTVRTRGFLEAWTQPPATDMLGQPQATTPPAEGTTQYWSKFVAPVVAGANTIRLPRMGNFIRNLLFVYRDVTPSRATGEANWPDPFQTFWDTRLLHNFIARRFRSNIAERYGFAAAIEAAGGRDNGVYPYDFCHEFDSKVGQELRDGWLPTVQSTRFEIVGTFGVAGTLTILTNDVAPAGPVFLS